MVRTLLCIFAKRILYSIIMIMDFQHIALCLLAVLVLAIVVMIIYNRIYYRREKDIITRTSQMNTQLALVLDSNKTQIWTFDPMKRIFGGVAGRQHWKRIYAARLCTVFQP